MRGDPLSIGRVLICAVALQACDSSFLHGLDKIEAPGDGSECPGGRPVLVARADSDGSVNLSWDFDQDVTFVVQRSEDGVAFSTIADRVASKSFRDQDVRDRDLRYQVRPVNITCPESNVERLRTAPKVPSNLQADSRFEGLEIYVDVSWLDSNELTGNCFDVARSPAWPSGSIEASEPELVDGPLEPETNYEYSVTTFFSCAVRVLDSGGSASISVTTPPRAVRELRVVDEQAGRVVLSWDDPNETTERILVRRARANALDSPIDVTSLAPGANGFDDQDPQLAPGTEYSYFVLVEAPGGFSATSSIGARTTVNPVLSLEEPRLDRDCLLEVPSSISLDPRVAGVQSITGTLTLPLRPGASIPLMASETGLEAQIPSNALDLDTLAPETRFEAVMTVLDTAGGLSVAASSALMKPLPAVLLSPASITQRSSGILAVTGFQPLSSNGIDQCPDCRGPWGSLAVGLDHVCALVERPSPGRTRVVCWGHGSRGEAGTGARIESYPNPRIMCDGPGPMTEPGCPPLTDAVQVTAGQGFSCVLLSNGHVRCTGENAVGSLGLGRVGGSDGSDNEPFLRPVCRSGSDEDGDCVVLTGVDRIRSGRGLNSCALFANGEILCWGSPFPANPMEPCSQGDVTDLDCAQPLRDVRAVGMGNQMTCFVLRDGTARCFGANDRGQLGTGAPTSGSFLELHTVCREGSGSTCVPLDDLVTVDGGLAHACALDASGSVWCWGDNEHGQLGSGDLSNANSFSPVRVCREEPGGTCAPLADGVALAIGQDFGCVLLEDGTVECWGDAGSNAGTNIANPLGDGLPDRENPRPFAGPVCESGRLESGGGCQPLGSGLRGRMMAVSAGQSAVCALTENGEILCWGGQGTLGTLGHGSSYGDAVNPVPVCSRGNGDGNDCPPGSVLSDGARRTCVPLAIAPEP